jgi:hypothetical protein
MSSMPYAVCRMPYAVCTVCRMLYEAGSLMAVIQIGPEFPPVGFQLFHSIFCWVPSQAFDLKNDVSEIWIRFLELVQILDAPKP